MRIAVLFFLVFAAGSSVVEAAWALVANSPREAPGGLEFSERRVEGVGGGATLWVVSFQPKTHSFAVLDNPDGAFDLGSAAEKRGVLAAVNGGYFHPDRTPLGLVVRKGETIHPQERAKLLSGVISATANGVAIQRASAFRAGAAVREALQAGPFLVEGGKPIAGLNATRAAARTVAFMDAKGRAGVLIGKSVSLAEMAAILATPEIFTEGKIVRALNLDGGSSTALWVRGSPAFYAREWKGVRNYLGITAR